MLLATVFDIFDLGRYLVICNMNYKLSHCVPLKLSITFLLSISASGSQANDLSRQEEPLEALNFTANERA